MGGVYISYPFCSQKCSFCNFASGVFAPDSIARYGRRLLEDIRVHTWNWQPETLYFGGGTPSLIDGSLLREIFSALPTGSLQEITLECAPGNITSERLNLWRDVGINRLSLGVQSFVAGELRQTGRRHTAEIVAQDVTALRSAGIANINIDLIAGLPHQTSESWRESVQSSIVLGVPHVSVYMLEVDDDSRLGRELIAGGTRYHAHFVPDEELTADFYESACEQLNAAGVAQYEISNFGREAFQSRHNLKYWTRQPYLGFGIDAHSMLRSTNEAYDAVRFCTPDSLERYVANAPLQQTQIDSRAGMEETFFLGLRLNEGVSLQLIRQRFGNDVVNALSPTVADLQAGGLLDWQGDRIRLTSRGRLLSNEVFERFLAFHETFVSPVQAGMDHSAISGRSARRSNIS